MKFNHSYIAINELLSHKKAVSFLVSLLFSMFFLLVRIICKAFGNTNGSIMIISLQRIGDTIFTIPAIKEIQKKFDEKIIIVCFSESVPIYKLAFSNIDYCILEHDALYLNRRLAISKARRKLKILNSSLVFDLTGSMVSASLIFNLKAKRIIGINGYSFRKIYDDFVEYRKNPQLMDIYLDAISPVIKVLNRDEFNFQPKELNSAGRILIQPFAGWKEKEWNLKKFLCLAEQLKRIYDVSVIVPIGQIDSDVLFEIFNLDINIIQTTSIEELIDLINECSLFIGNDSGPVNIANFLGKPTVTIFGSTNPIFTITKVAHQKYITKELICSAKANEKFCLTGLAQYKCSGNQCMSLLSVKEVYNVLQPLLNAYCTKK